MDNKSIKKYTKIFRSCYPPRSSSSTRVHYLFYMAGGLVKCLLCFDYLYYYDWGKINVANK